MRILLVAPDTPDIESIPEIRDMTRMQHRVMVLNGHVSDKDVFQEVERNEWDAIHFACHSDSDFVYLSRRILKDGQQGDYYTLKPEDVLQLARRARSILVFFNSCDSSRFASYLTLRGVKNVIATTTILLQRDAWKMPLAFYGELKRQLENGIEFDVATAFLSATSGDGTYIIAQSVRTRTEQDAILDKIQELKIELDAVRQELMWWRRIVPWVIAGASLTSAAIGGLIASWFGG